MNKRVNLNAFPLFQGLSPDLLETWSTRFSSRTFSKRQTLVFPPHGSDAIYLVQYGKVKISIYSEDGKEFTVSLLSAGDIFSEHSHAVATAVEKSEIFYTGMSDFQSMLADSPELARRLIRLLGQILRLSNDIIFDLAFREAASRLASVFLRSAGDSSSVYLTHEELAAMSGTTRQTVNEILRRWERQGILSLQRGHVLIHDFDLLKEKCEP